MAKTSNKTPGEATPKTTDDLAEEPQLEVASAPQSAGDTTAAAPDRDRIAMRAYELYLARGAADGDAVEDWLTAEREFTHRPTDE